MHLQLGDCAGPSESRRGASCPVRTEGRCGAGDRRCLLTVPGEQGENRMNEFTFWQDDRRTQELADSLNCF